MLIYSILVKNAPVLVFSLVPDIFLAYKCYHESPLVAMAVQRKDPLVRKQGSGAAGLPCWGAAKQGFSFIQCFSHCIFVLAQLTTKGKRIPLHNHAGVKQKKAGNQRNLRAPCPGPFQTLPTVLLALPGSKRISVQAKPSLPDAATPHLGTCLKGTQVYRN